MLKALTIISAFRTARPPDLETGNVPDEEAAKTNSPSTYGELGDDYDEDEVVEEELDGDLDHEHDTNDIIRDMEEPRSEKPDGVPLSRGRTYSSELSFADRERRKSPDWYRKLKEFLSTRTTPQDLEAYVPNYRYTPIISSIVIPFSILLEIPGLTEHWYVRTVNNQVVERRPNPIILNIGLGFSMACALAANICLVVRFLEKKVKLMTIGCIVFLTIHDLINIIAVTVFGVEHRFHDGFTYGQSFWLTVCSTIVSSFTNLTLIYDLLFTPDFANSGSGLTRRQRSLAIVVIFLLCYIAFGALINSILIGLNFIDAMYFTLVSMETIGFGDITPKSTGSRIFTCVHAVFGILTLAFAVGLTRETVLEGLEVGYRKRVQEVRLRRRIARWRRRVTNRWREAIEWRLREGGHPVWVKDPQENWLGGRMGTGLNFLEGLLPWSRGSKSSSGFLLGHGHGHHPHGMRLNLEALSWKQLEAAAMEAGVPLNTLLPEGFRERCKDSGSYNGSSRAGESSPTTPQMTDVERRLDENIPLTHARLGRMIAMIGGFAIAVDKSGHLRGDPSAVPVPARREGPVETPQFKKSLTLQYDAFRSGMAKEEAKAFYARLVVVWMLFLMFWIIGSAIFTKTEGWGFWRSMYFCVIAFTTIGFGDLSPQTPAGRSIFVAWALLGVATMTILISVISETFSSKYHSALHTGVFDRAVKRYRERARVIAEKTRRGRDKLFAPGLEPGASRSRSLSRPTLTDQQRTEDALKETHARTQLQLEALPHKILADARVFHEHLSYFIGAGNKVVVDSGDALPPGLQQLINEITGAAKIGERIKREILQDEDARHTLFTLSIEQALRKMISSAESALNALEERESLSEQRQLQASGSTSSSPLAGSSGGEACTTPVQNNADADTPVTLDVRSVGRTTGVKYTRWDTTTSSEFSDWR
ncbi:hypothetical protein GGX14DRAFT_662452 [Mycena pura]|uniref:Potassium channel domain-containing protein n=1 Tax=Mycena pura TaxID=153505 RepID=A0AAD6V4F1_9AGAR|nr:hypothetical protein GGX14DRAFT_662452 [Mycena pura]